MSRAERHQRMTAYGLCSFAAARFLFLGSGVPRWAFTALVVAIFGLWISAYLAAKREASQS
jgi:hypothetical protein